VGRVEVPDTDSGRRYGYMQINQCRVCGVLAVWWVLVLDDEGTETIARLLYPMPRDDRALPEKVRSRLEAADRVRGLDPGLYAVAIRRTLETVFNDLGAEGRDLFRKTKDLVDKGQLPPKVAVAVSHLRDIGKYGAHDEVIEVTKDDVPLIEKLVEAVLEYVYRSPAAIAALEASVLERGGRISAVRPPTQTGQAGEH